jgi:hypothetical protein
LTVPKALEDKAVPGVYTASFTLEAPTYGPDQGKVVASLVGLVAVDPAMLRRAPSSSAAGK